MGERMNPYLSVGGNCVTEKTIEKSRFITSSRHVEGEEQAKAFVAEIASKYSDATHNCFAYICDALGNYMRFSDDGEPQGTAGMPILEVIKNKKLMQTAVVVTRYFGGIKLGAGGLLRAYSGCASENLDRAVKVSFEVCSESLYRVEYSGAETALRFFSDNGADILETVYADGAMFRAAVRKSGEENFNKSLIDRLNGRVSIEKLKEYYFPFRL